MARIAVLGLGGMGSRMAARLIGAGHQVTVWNRSAGPALALRDQGATVADSPRAATKGAELTLAMLRDDAVSERVWSDPVTGALVGLAPGALAVEASTLTPARARAWADAVRAAGGRPVEAPVSGSRPQAAAGALVFLMGGAAADLAAAQPILATLGSAFHALGPVGAGAVAKLVTNSLLTTQVIIWAELLPLMQREGLDMDRALAALSTVSAWAPVAGYLTTLMRMGDHAPQFPVALMRKDIDYTLQVGPAEALPLITVLRDRLDAAIAAGLGEENMTAVVRLASTS